MSYAAKKRTFILAAILLTAVFFSCRGMRLSSFVPAPAAHGHAVACCMDTANQEAVLHSQLSDALQVFVVLLFAAAAASYITARYREMAGFAEAYMRKVRLRFGSSALFCKYIDLLRKGILHPKLF